MPRAGSSRKAVYVTHKKQTVTQRRINRMTGVREAERGRARTGTYRGIRKAFGMSTG